MSELHAGPHDDDLATVTIRHDAAAALFDLDGKSFFAPENLKPGMRVKITGEGVVGKAWTSFLETRGARIRWKVIVDDAEVEPL